MLQFSHDPDAGVLYCYFTELESGQAVDEIAYPVSVLLDANDQVIGFQFDLDDELTLDQLDLALELPHTWLDSGRLRVGITDDDPKQIVAVEDVALFDLDENGRVLGADITVPAEFRAAERLARLAPLMLALDDDDSDAAPAPALAIDGSTSLPGTTAEVARVGVVALVGKPNVGKSTLLNALLGQKVAIVSPRAQTTRAPLRGILHRPNAQIIFIDTPGIHDPRHKLGAFMVTLARQAIRYADVICFMVDISRPPSQLDKQIAAQVQRERKPRLLLLNKVDQPPRAESHLDAYRALGSWDMEVAISARKREGLTVLIDEITQRLPHGPRLYPDDQIVDQTEQHLAAELVREKVLRYTEHEVPHSVAVEVDEWQDKDQTLYIRMTINVERESQKGILIGAGGGMLKQIGSAARGDIEKMLGRDVYLDLWVKVRENWRDNSADLGWLGYTLRDWK